MVRNRAVAVAAGLLLMSSALTVVQAGAPAEATGTGTTCKDVTAKAMVTNTRHQAIGYLSETFRFCWHYLGNPAQGDKITGAKVRSVVMKMPPDFKPCNVEITRTDLRYDVKTFKGIGTKRFTAVVQGTYWVGQYIDVSPRDCKNYHYERAWIYYPKVTIVADAGGKVRIFAPPVTS